jgi:hypothetical protein
MHDDTDFEDLTELVHKNKNLDFGLFHEFLDHFQQHGGFDLLRAALKTVVPSERRKSLPLDLIPILTAPFKNCSNILNPEYAKEMSEELQSVIIGRLENMSDDEMKDIDKSTINKILLELRDFLCIGLQDNSVDERLESVKLSMALRFLKSSNMKKRLNGINEIKAIIESTTDLFVRRSWKDDDSPRKSRWLKPEYLCKWISDNKLVEYILGDSSHIEVIKRSATVLQFLSHNKQLTKHHLDLLWRSLEDKHEATVLGVYETINEIAEDLDKKAVDYIFSKIKSIPLKKYNEQTVKFVKDFTIKALKVAKKGKSSKELVDISSDENEENKSNEFYLENAKEIIDGTVPEPENETPEYGLPLLYGIIHKNSELGTHTLKEFIELFKIMHCHSFIPSYILKCIHNLQNGVHVYQSISIIISMFQRAFPARTLNSASSTDVAIIKLNEKFDLVTLIIANIERYNALVQKSMIELVNKGIVPENISKFCFEGNVMHSDYLEKQFELLEFFIIHSNNEICIGSKNIENLWNIFVSRSSIEFDKNLFFKWLSKEKFNKPAILSSSNRSIFTSEERHFLFTQILCKNEYVDNKEMSYNCFKCFEKYFGFENRYNKFIMQVKNQYKIMDFEQIQGLESLWEIVIK